MVFVDETVDRGWRLGPNAHLLPQDDSPEALAELHRVAAKVGMRRAWFQDEKWPHYDLVAGRAAAAEKLPNVARIGCTAYIRMRRIMKRGRFIEPGSGLTMNLDEWYILSDSGSAYSSTGWNSAENAVRAALDLTEYALSPEDVSVWCPINPANGVEDANVANVVRGLDLLIFWSATDYSEILRSERQMEGA